MEDMSNVASTSRLDRPNRGDTEEYYQHPAIARQMLQWDHDYCVEPVASPLRVQKIKNALDMKLALQEFQKICSQQPAEPKQGVHMYKQLSKGAQVDLGKEKVPARLNKHKFKCYKKERMTAGRQWMEEILCENSDDSSSSDEEVGPAGVHWKEEWLKHELELHELEQEAKREFDSVPTLKNYEHFAAGLFTEDEDKYKESKILRKKPGERKAMMKNAEKQKQLSKKLTNTKVISKPQKDVGKKMKSVNVFDRSSVDRMIEEMREAARKQGKYFGKSKVKKDKQEKQDNGKKKQKEIKQQKRKDDRKLKKVFQDAAKKRRKIWSFIQKKEVCKMTRSVNSSRNQRILTCKKLANACMRRQRKIAAEQQKASRDKPRYAKQLSKEMLLYWKCFDKVEKQHRKQAEKVALEQRKMDDEFREAKRQQRKLNFLITQTELYSHFMAKKMSSDESERQAEILGQLEEEEISREREVAGIIVEDLEEDNYNSDEMKRRVLQNVSHAMHAQKKQCNTFSVSDINTQSSASSMDLSKPEFGEEHTDITQPLAFVGALKGYQLKGMNWLISLYESGINGILADEMGLGKTVQSIAFLAYLAETLGIWGPFLIVAPASTLHNWQQELTRFMPRFKTLPYWGNQEDRRILRQFWNTKNLSSVDSQFHVLITSYQLVTSDAKYFSRVKWQYMILDEAQAIKSNMSLRWKTLLAFQCRNRLLLTGTPIQNKMAELWALLHFIMPTLFDSHHEFADWFSKDIESHAENKSELNTNQLTRLHMILKPFMLRRLKKDVENELSEKIEVLMYCPLTARQKMLYDGIKRKISIEDMLMSSLATETKSSTKSSASSLMNLVMQFRKVCNHPELFERREPRSCFFMDTTTLAMPKLLYREVLMTSSNNNSALSIFTPYNISSGQSDLFSLAVLLNLSGQELSDMMLGGMYYLLHHAVSHVDREVRLYHNHLWGDMHNQHRVEVVITPYRVLSHASVIASQYLYDLCFTAPAMDVYTHTHHTMHYMKESESHRVIRHRSHQAQQHSVAPGEVVADTVIPLHPHVARSSVVLEPLPTSLPTWTYNWMSGVHKVRARVQWYCSDRSAQYYHDRMAAVVCYSDADCGYEPPSYSLLRYGSKENHLQYLERQLWFRPTPVGGLLSAALPSHIHLPDKEVLVTDAGKLSVLDLLLVRLKAEGHRVLIYSQMTRMIDLLEEFMWHRQHKYIRLDGSSRIHERRDMVDDFQTRSDIFVFLLSTRAGGLGINLTAADTVIFYDSDWNPTVDQQAMDRAHRLGQTKQVTVYRLICKGTVEERILQRAKEKSEIHRMVMHGEQFNPDQLKPKEVVTLLLDDQVLEHKFEKRKSERGSLVQEAQSRKGKRKTSQNEKLSTELKVPKKRGRKPKVSRPSATDVASPSSSVPPSPAVLNPLTPESAASLSLKPSGQTSEFDGEDTNSNDALVIMEDESSLSKSKKKRGRPKGSKSLKLHSTGSATLAAAQEAAKRAGVSAAYEKYGFACKEQRPNR